MERGHEDCLSSHTCTHGAGCGSRAQLGAGLDLIMTFFLSPHPTPVYLAFLYSHRHFSIVFGTLPPNVHQ